MIENPTLGLIAIFIANIGILIAERRTAILLGLATIMLTVIFFMV